MCSKTHNGYQGSEVAQRKRVGLITQRSEDRNLPSLSFCPTKKKRFLPKKILPPGIEPGTYRVLGGRHNQLDQGSYAISRIRTGVAAATKRSTNHYTNTASGIFLQCLALIC
jgi:hypothetical protein